jgi:hypothetical protein
MIKHDKEMSEQVKAIPQQPAGQHLVTHDQGNAASPRPGTPLPAG